MSFSEIVDLIRSKFGAESVIEVNESSTPSSIEVSSSEIVAVLTELYEHKDTYFDMLSCITGMDNGVESNTMEVFYNLYSIPYNFQLMVKVKLDREKPIVKSVSNIWQTANWHEREAFDLLGIHFEGHPDLRRILLPADWEGHPLRKDYTHQEYYHGIKVEY